MKKQEFFYLVICILGFVNQTGLCGQNTKSDKKNWQIYQSTVAFCPFRLEYPRELGLSQERGLEETQKSYGLFKMIVWMPEVLDPETHPIQLGLGVRIYKKPNKAEEDTDLLLPGTTCGEAFPFDDETISTFTTTQGFKAEEYRYCESVMADYAIEGGLTEFDAGQVPHEIFVRILHLPTCTVKFTVEMPTIFEKDYSKKDPYLPAKDTPGLKKKKQDIRRKLFKTLSSFKYLGDIPKLKTPRQEAP